MTLIQKILTNGAYTPKKISQKLIPIYLFINFNQSGHVINFINNDEIDVKTCRETYYLLIKIKALK